MAFITYVYIVAAFLVADSFQTQFQTCSNGGPTPVKVEVTGCTTLPCPFKKGSSVTGDLTFVVPRSTKTLKPDVNIQLGDMHIKYPLPQQNACLGLTNARCPLDKGEQVTYKLKMPVEKFYPKVSMVIDFALVDDQGQVQMCVKIPAKVID
ncbi:NPC intracellular cholesterol transporter 2 [Calliopsis andreniformis]|uniref:NPC intracellular cholesterol transporter 2 n=1 Tax=Calliopsis andreniformis TaxID=337506 RepID=UPI003FCEC9FC